MAKVRQDLLISTTLATKRRIPRVERLGHLGCVMVLLAEEDGLFGNCVEDRGHGLSAVDIGDQTKEWRDLVWHCEALFRRRLPYSNLVEGMRW